MRITIEEKPLMRHLLYRSECARVRRGLLLAAVAASALLLVGTPLLLNTWMLLIGNGYEIPRESSMLTFHPTEMNQGSGDWWIYGEDFRNYYYMRDEGEDSYVVFPKEKAKHCAGFEPLQRGTWCLQSQGRS